MFSLKNQGFCPSGVKRCQRCGHLFKHTHVPDLTGSQTNNPPKIACHAIILTAVELPKDNQRKSKSNVCVLNPILQAKVQRNRFRCCSYSCQAKPKEAFTLYQSIGASLFMCIQFGPRQRGGAVGVLALGVGFINCSLPQSHGRERGGEWKRMKSIQLQRTLAFRGTIHHLCKQPMSGIS